MTNQQKFIDQNYGQIELFKECLTLSKEQLKEHTRLKATIGKTKLYPRIINKDINLKKLITYKETWLDIYQRSNGTHSEKKFAADKNIGMKLAQTYLLPYTKRKLNLEALSKANAQLKKKLNQTPDTELRVGAKGEKHVKLSESKTVETKKKT